VTTPSRLTAPPGRPLRHRQHGRGPPVARLREAGESAPGPSSPALPGSAGTQASTDPTPGLDTRPARRRRL